MARAVVVTHLYGRMAPVNEIVARARSANVAVIEDCAQAHGAAVDGRRAGTFGAVGCFSFYPTKNLGALGDGGAVVTSDADMASRLRSLRQYGWSAKYDVASAGGRNSRLDEMQAAFLRAKLPHLPAWNAARVAIARRYCDGLRELPVRVPAVAQRTSTWRILFVIRCARSRRAARASCRFAGSAPTSTIRFPITRRPTELRGARPQLPVTDAATAAKC